MKTDMLEYKRVGHNVGTVINKKDARFTKNILSYLSKMNLIIIPAAFLLGRISLLGGLMPFGIALYAAALGINVSRIMVAVAILAGMLTNGATTQIFTAVIAMLLFNALNLPFKITRNSILRHAITAFFCVVIPEMIFTYLQGFLLYDVIKSFFNSFIIFALVFVFKNVLILLEDISEKYAFSNEEILSVAIACTLAMAGLGNVSIMDISIRNILCIFLILVFSYKSGAGNGAAIGVLVGTIISISSNASPITIASYAMCGLLSGVLRKLGKVGCCVGVAMGNVLLTFYTNGSIEILTYLYEILAAMLLFLIIPQKLMDAMVKKFERTLSKGGDKKGYSLRIKEMAVQKLNKFSNAFNEMARTFEEISETKTVTERQDITSIFDRVAERVCKDCSLCMHCWDRNFCNTYQVMFKIVEKLDSKGWIDHSDIPEYFLKRCERIEDFVSAVNNVFEVFKVDMLWRSKIGESRGMVSQQLKSMSRIILNLASELNTDITFKGDIEDQISLELSKSGINDAEVIVYENRFGKLEISITHSGCGGKRVCLNKVEKLVSNITGRVIVKDDSECCMNSKAGTCTLKLIEQETYKVLTGVARVSKNEKYVSGDNYTFLNSGDGRYIAALSDGMGTGHKACMQSKATINLIEQFLESGFDKDTTVKLINSVLVLRSNDDSFATIDMSLIDLYSGEIEFVKVGAAPTFIKREDTVETIRAASLPAGILSELEIELIHKNISNGDFLIMVTDGITDAFKQTGKHRTIQEEIQQLASKNPQELADNIMEAAISCCEGEQPVDDMLVLVAKVWKTNN